MNYNTSYPPPPSNQAQHYNVDYKPMPQENEIQNAPKRQAKISGKWLEIAFCFFIMTVPMLIFSALLLGLVYKYRIKDNEFASPNLRFTSSQLNSNAVYVDLSATLLTTVASWSSTVAPILVGFAITLLTFPVAKGMMNAANLNQPDRLPTPYQLALMVRMNTASAANSLYHWLRYVLFFRKGRSKQPAGLTWMTAIIVVSWLLSVLVFAADTWLHIATKSVNLVQVGPSSDTQNLTFALMPGCTTSNNSMRAAFQSENACMLNPLASTTTLMHSEQWLQVVNNVSTSRSVKTVVHDGKTYVYLGNAEQPRLERLDYSANSYAIQTECKPVTSSCMNEDDFAGNRIRYNCPFNFAGDLAINPWAMSYYTDSSMSDNVTDTGIENPYHFAVAAAQSQNLGRVNLKLDQDPEIMVAVHGATLFALTCTSTVYDLEYSSVNGSVTRWEASVSNSSVANILQSVQAFAFVGTNQLQDAAAMAMFSNTSAEVAESFAQAYGRISMSAAAGALQSTPGLETQVRSNIIAARVPYAPLIALVVANLLLVILGIILSALAVFSASGDAAEAQARLSVQAIVAQVFENDRARLGVESTDALYDEYEGIKSQKVGIIKTENGGWTFGSWRVAK